MPEEKIGRLYIAGIGPGGTDQISPRCLAALEQADLIVGYTRYISFVRDIIDGKEIYTSGMRKEKERTEHALTEARKGRTVCLVSGGDPGVYALAGLALELAAAEDLSSLRVEIIPGITAATAAAAALGAPLMHDFAVISLSDLLTDAGLIEKRLRFAAEGDFVTVLYNPRSTKRHELFDKLPSIFLPCRHDTTPTGIVRDAGRNEETVILTTLGKMAEHAEEVQMGSTVIIGNSKTFIKEWAMITPRGYKTGTPEV